ncbi:hypothetical protein LGH82_30620 [Mesorhizobium sp. PAMC28654]|uniref:PaaX family transcriptional regulator n=1 Tax=Mesorhizobium sp. PAMC28654 TaxID=2880934 RepID=UPI001D0A4A49|nr:PaaX family transcriptional regulator C-terminal domain-containing protein [Mesorhizobium sp. PAMC28654]UDL89368.1 hypothetical protein LGH82_30620 [Mesorhizobium sp. PAMC28654]
MLRETTDSLPQRMLVTLLAEFASVRSAPIASSVLVDIFEDFGISVDATRTALSRLVSKSLLVRQKDGRSTSYALSPSAATMIREDRDRILKFGEPQEWDGRWTLVAFSVSEAQRERRHTLRSQLRGLGFAPLFDGLWGAAFASEDDARKALEFADVPESLVARGEISMLGAKINTFHRAWKLDDIAMQYNTFIADVAPIVERAEKGEVAPAEALLIRTRIMDDWRTFPINDPGLPRELLPDGWPREYAHQLFIRAYELLKPPAELRLKMLMQTTSPGKRVA